MVSRSVTVTDSITEDITDSTELLPLEHLLVQCGNILFPSKDRRIVEVTKKKKTMASLLQDF